MPGQDGRRQVLGIHTRGMPLAEDVDLGALARMTGRFAGADPSALAREAAIDAVRRVLPQVNLREGIPPEILAAMRVCRGDFESALKRNQTMGTPLAGDMDLAGIAHRTHGYTGADLGDVIRRAGLMALRRDLQAPAIGREAFEKALSKTGASVTPEMERD